MEGKLVYQSTLRKKFTCKGWNLDDLISRSGFVAVPRVSVLTDKDVVLKAIRRHENSGVPLVIEDFHRLQDWPAKLFDPRWLMAKGLKEIPVRNVHNGEDRSIPTSDFIAASRQISVFAQPDETERLYGKDVPCPDRWKEWLSSGAIPRCLLEDSQSNLSTNLPKEQQIETLMCYLGVGDTFTPIHKDLCASSGQNLMCYTENGGSSYWFMTDSSSSRLLANHFLSVNKILDHETHIMSLDEAAKAAAQVPIYVIEQRVGDLVLVPPRSWHQVVNSGGLTIKTSWSRMTLRGLQAALYHELPLYRRVCRLETYRIKATIYHTVLRWTTDLLNHQDHRDPKSISIGLAVTLKLFDSVLSEEYCPQHEQLEVIHTEGSASMDSGPDFHCDFCGSDIFQSFFYCGDCVQEKRTEIADGFILCPGCYIEGRTCKCRSLKPAQWRSFERLLSARQVARVALHDYWEVNPTLKRGPLQEEMELLHMSSKNGIFSACILLEEQRRQLEPKGDVRRCSVSRGPAHDVPSDAGINCKECHRSRCFYHIIHSYYMHSVQILHILKHEKTIHKHHKLGKTNFQQKWKCYEDQEKEGKQPAEIQLTDLALTFATCKPLQPAFVIPGWYDEKIEIIRNAEGSLDHLQPGYCDPVATESGRTSSKRKRLFLDCVLLNTRPHSRSLFTPSPPTTSEGDTDGVLHDLRVQPTQEATEDCQKRRRTLSRTPPSG